MYSPLNKQESSDDKLFGEEKWVIATKCQRCLGVAFFALPGDCEEAGYPADQLLLQNIKKVEAVGELVESFAFVLCGSTENHTVSLCIMLVIITRPSGYKWMHMYIFIAIEYRHATLDLDLEIFMLQ